MKPGDYRRVFSDGLRSVDRCFLVLACSSGFQRSRLGLAVSKKISRRAVDRNRIKRLIRESFRIHQHRLVGLDLVVVARQGASRADNRDCFESLHQHWKRVAEQCVC
ncbi:MAG: ribonuclease P protein component [Chromatiales bacterium]